MTNETALREALAALEPFAGHTDKRGETIVLKWGESTYTGTLTPEHFYRATEACRTIRHLLQSPSQPVVAEAVDFNTPPHMDPEFVTAWCKMEDDGYIYSESNVAKVHLGWCMAKKFAHPQASPPPVQK